MKLVSKIDKNKLPKHIAFIIDGNGRWAKKRNLTRSMGHKYGMDQLKNIVFECYNLGIKHVSIYCFSTENWTRPKQEVDYLMTLFKDFLDNETDKYLEKNIKLNIMGDISKFSSELQESIVKSYELLKSNNEFILNLGVNYGGHDEILRAVNLCIDSGVTNVDKNIFEKCLYTSGQPNLDFVVRTSGEQRLSNFMLWQVAYSELYFPKTFWPDFSIKMLYKSLINFQSRNRRFGSIKE